MTNNFNSPKITAYFDHSARQFGNTVSAVGWFNRDTQQRRFEVLSALPFSPTDRILDVGCGLGDFYGFLTQKFGEPPHHYTGIDLSPRMIQIAKRQYPNAAWQVQDLFQLPDQTWDCITASGTFNHVVPDKDVYITAVIQKLALIAKKWAAFNLLIPDRFLSPPLQSFDPDTIHAIGKKWGIPLQITTGYLPNDFTVYIVPDNS